MASALYGPARPYGPTAPGLDMVPVPNPASDVPLVGVAFHVLTAGVVSVTTEAGEDRTFTAAGPMFVPVAITAVLAATEADLLVII